MVREKKTVHCMGRRLMDVYPPLLCLVFLYCENLSIPPSSFHSPSLFLCLSLLLLLLLFSLVTDGRVYGRDVHYATDLLRNCDLSQYDGLAQCMDTSIL